MEEIAFKMRVKAALDGRLTEEEAGAYTRSLFSST